MFRLLLYIKTQETHLKITIKPYYVGTVVADQIYFTLDDHCCLIAEILCMYIKLHKSGVCLEFET